MSTLQACLAVVVGVAVAVGVMLSIKSNSDNIVAARRALYVRVKAREGSRRSRLDLTRQREESG